MTDNIYVLLNGDCAVPSRSKVVGNLQGDTRLAELDALLHVVKNAVVDHDKVSDLSTMIKAMILGSPDVALEIKSQLDAKQNVLTCTMRIVDIGSI